MCVPCNTWADLYVPHKHQHGSRSHDKGMGKQMGICQGITCSFSSEGCVILTPRNTMQLCRESCMRWKPLLYAMILFGLRISDTYVRVCTQRCLPLPTKTSQDKTIQHNKRTSFYPHSVQNKDTHLPTRSHLFQINPFLIRSDAHAMIICAL